MIRRRTVLKSVGSSDIAASTAGCFVFPGGGNGLRLESVDLTNHAAHQYGELSTEKVALVEAARANGEYVTYGHQPFTDGEYVEVDGTFYRVDVTKTGTKQLTPGARVPLIETTVPITSPRRPMMLSPSIPTRNLISGSS